MEKNVRKIESLNVINQLGVRSQIYLFEIERLLLIFYQISPSFRNELYV